MRVAVLAEFPILRDRVGGGIQEVTRRFTSALAARPDVDVHVISFHQDLEGGAPVVEEIQGTTVHRQVLAGRFGNVTFGRAERMATLDLIRRIDPDVVHPLGIGPKALAAAECGRPWVVTVNGAQAAETFAVGGLKNRVRGWVFRKMEDASIDRARTIIVPNPVVKAMLDNRLRHARVFTIENAVDPRFFDLPDEGDPALVTVLSRVIPHKNAETLIDAAGSVAARGHDFRIRWIGPADHDEYLSTLRRRVRDAGLGDRFEFVGFVSDDELFAELGAAGAMALPSLVEIAPISIMQGMSAGLACLATDVGGTRHLVEDGVTGLLVPGTRETAPFEQALERLLANPDATLRMGAEGRRRARERFRVERVVDRTMEVYGTVLPASSRVGFTGSKSRNPLEYQYVTADSEATRETS